MRLSSPLVLILLVLAAPYAAADPTEAILDRENVSVSVQVAQVRAVVARCVELNTHASPPLDVYQC